MAVSVLSRKVSKPNFTDWNEIKRVLSYLKGSKHFKLCVGTNQELKLEGFTDSDWAGDCNGRKSTSGCLFKLGNSTIHYAARKQNIVTLSSTEAELVALTEASQQGVWILRVLKDFGLKTVPKIFVDNQSTLKILESEKISSRSKHIDVKYFYARDLLQNRTILYQYLPTDEMIADIFTKPLSKIKFCKFRNCLGLNE